MRREPTSPSAMLVTLDGGDVGHWYSPYHH